MKKTILLSVLTLCYLTGNAQDSKAKFKLHAANMGFGAFSMKKGMSEGSGATFFMDLTAALDKNLISLSYLAGSDIGVLDNAEYKFDEVSLLYGREWKALEWLRFEGFAGIGRYHQQVDYYDYDPNFVYPGNVISIPLRINTKFYFSKKFGMGFNSNYSINSVNNNFSTNLLFHYRFN